jgi:hypothetical protein
MSCQHFLCNNMLILTIFFSEKGGEQWRGTYLQYSNGLGLGLGSKNISRRFS